MIIYLFFSVKQFEACNRGAYRIPLFFFFHFRKITNAEIFFFPKQYKCCINLEIKGIDLRSGCMDFFFRGPFFFCLQLHVVAMVACRPLFFNPTFVSEIMLTTKKILLYLFYKNLITLKLEYLIIKQFTPTFIIT